MPRGTRLNADVAKITHSLRRVFIEFSTALFAIFNCVEVLSGDHNGAFSAFQLYLEIAGETAKRGQNDAICVLPEARQCHAFARGLYAQRRVQMSRQLNAGAIGFSWLMAAGKRAQRIRLSDDVQTPIRGRIASVAIMIAAYKIYINVPVSRSECSEIAIQRLGVTGPRMHQIAQDHQTCRLMRRQKRRNAIQIAAGMTAR